MILLDSVLIFEESLCLVVVRKKIAITFCEKCTIGVAREEVMAVLVS